MKKTVVAICYDFDKTLATNDMQAFRFIPNLGMTEAEFWKKRTEFSEKHNADPTLSFMLLMLDECNKRGIKLTKKYLNDMGRDIRFFDGVLTWFKRINAYAESRGVKLEHYLISTGNREIIEGCPIYKEFKIVYGSEYLYGKDGVAYWPKNIVNYTLKTQHLFRICKGVTSLKDEMGVNERVTKKHVEFRNMVYIGDGYTDVPCMTLVKEKGGTAIAVYPKGKDLVSKKLLEDDRVNFICESDYSANSALEKLMKLIIDTCELKDRLAKQKQ